MPNVWYVSRDPMVADDGCEIGTSTSFTQNVDNLFDLDALMRKYKKVEGGVIEELGDKEMLKEAPHSISSQGNACFVYLLSSYLWFMVTFFIVITIYYVGLLTCLPIAEPGIDIDYKVDTVAEELGPEMDATLQFVVGELRKKRKKEVDDELAHNPKKSTEILPPKTRACKKL